MSMRSQLQLHSELIDLISGIENVHFSSSSETHVVDKLIKLFGKPSNDSADWKEFKIKGFDLAVINSMVPKVVITFRVKDINGVREILSAKFDSVGDIQTGDYGQYIEISLTASLYIHFFESKKRCRKREHN